MSTAPSNALWSYDIRRGIGYVRAAAINDPPERVFSHVRSAERACVLDGAHRVDVSAAIAQNAKA